MYVTGLQTAISLHGNDGFSATSSLSTQHSFVQFILKHFDKRLVRFFLNFFSTSVTPSLLIKDLTTPPDGKRLIIIQKRFFSSLRYFRHRKSEMLWELNWFHSSASTFLKFLFLPSFCFRACFFLTHQKTVSR